MDMFALEALNAIVGNSPDSAGLEWALAGGAIRFDASSEFAMGGASATAAINGESVAPFTLRVAKPGDELVVERFVAGQFLYIAFAGGVDVPRVLGSRCTYLPGRFGGYDGRMISRGATLPIGTVAASRVPNDGATPKDLFPDYGSERVRITRGPHADLFDAAAWRALLESNFTVSSASDRTGYRLKGNTIDCRAGNLPSDPGCQGAIQIPTDGQPIVLMADAPTVGGYPKIAVVAEVDMPVLAQKSPAEQVRFDLIEIEESQALIRERTLRLRALGATGAAPA
jgi:antagonist of KipI